MTPKQLDTGQRAFVRQAARDWSRFDAAMAEMGKGTGAWTKETTDGCE